MKMVFTTAACSFLFAGALLATRTLWTAIALHFIGNVVLHKITGLSNGAALFKPVLHDSYPTHYDPGFLAFLNCPTSSCFCAVRISAASVEARDRRSSFRTR